MFTSKNMVCDINSIPHTWIFEHYCNLQEKLSGQDVRIRSVFNKNERTPSMFIYFNNGTYKYKDFSSGNGGSAIDFVMKITNLTYTETCKHIINSYNNYILCNDYEYNVKELKKVNKYKIKDYEIRKWNNFDKEYWTKYNINSKLLEEYNVKPLKQYTIHKQNGEEYNEITISDIYLYGYFKNDGKDLYKIYQPANRDRKFFRVAEYLQGSEQLKGCDYLVITSSLKDIMALKSFNLSVDYIAPESENVMVKAEEMLKFFNKYKKVLILFDNDDAGIKAMRKYKEIYKDILIIILPLLSKDPSDSIKDFGIKKVFTEIVIVFNRKINEEST